MSEIGGYKQIRLKNGWPFLDWKSATLDELLSYQAFIAPDFNHFRFIGDGESITHEMTLQQAHDWASRVAGLLDRFLPQRSHVVLCFENGPEAVAGFFGCSYANMIPISGIYPSAPDSVTRLVNILEDSQAVAVIGLRQTLLDFRRLLPKGAPTVKWIPIEAAETVTPLYRRHAVDMHDVALVQYTSGSIGRPRGVQITHSNLGHNIILMLGRIGLYRGGLALCWLPLSHDMGLVTGLLSGLAMGGTCLLMSPYHFIEKPERWLKVISRYRVTFSVGPNFAYDLCTKTVSDETLKTLDLSCWKRSLIGAEMIERDTVEGFIKRFSSVGVNKNLIHSGYGMAETTLGIAGGGKNHFWDVEDSAADIKLPDGRHLLHQKDLNEHIIISREKILIDDHKTTAESIADFQGWIDEDEFNASVVTFKSFSRKGLAEGIVLPPQDELDERVMAQCGVALEGHKILVVDPETGTPLAEDLVGELWLSGPCVSPGYLNREQENKERFNLMVEGRPYFRSRDMGFFHDGKLYITGRLENRLIVGGHRFDPDDLASVIRQKCPCLGARSLAIFWDDRDLCLMGEVSNTAYEAQKESLIRDMADSLRKICPVKTLKVVLVRIGGMSWTPSGKIRLKATLESFREKRLPIIEERYFSTEELDIVPILNQPSVVL